MSIPYLVSLLCALVSLSPVKDNELVEVARFTLYVDANTFKDGELILLWDSKIELNVYKNDCEAFYDLSTFRYQICDPVELQRIKELFEKHHKPNYNKL